MKQKNLIWVTAFLVMCLLLPGFPSEAAGRITLKLMSSGKPVQNVSFKAYLIEDESDRQCIIEKNRDLSDEALEEKYGVPVTLGPSSSEGIITAELQEGYYYVRDAGKEPSFYAVILDISKDNSVIKSYPKAYGQGQIRLFKVSDSGETLKGAEFTLYRKCRGEILPVPIKGNSYDRNNGVMDAAIRTDENGVWEVKNLPCGEYFLKETRAPEGYILKEEELVFDVEKDKTIELVFENIKKETGEMTFLKVDSQTDNPLKGATFLVRVKKDGKYIPVKRDGKEYLITSNEKGIFKAEHLAYGAYDLVETAAPEGYRKLQESVKFEINKESRNKVIIIKNVQETKRRFRPLLPKTGTITVLLMSVAGLLLVIAGRRLMRDERKK